MSVRCTKTDRIRRKVFFGLFSLITISMWGQQFKEIKGRILNESLSVSGIHIINKTKGGATITDAEGNFSIVISPGDTLFFSGVQFTPKSLPVTEAVFTAQELQVYLDPFVNELEEVVVTQHNLSGNLASDMQSKAIVQPVNFYNLGIPGYGGKRAEKIVSGQSLLLSTLLLPISGIDVEAVYKHFSGYYKRLKKKRYLDQQFELSYRMIQFYGVQFLMDRFALSEDQVYEFITGAQENYSVNQAFQQNRHGEVLRDFENYATTFQTQK